MRLLAAVAFLTRVPVGRPFDAADVGRGSVFFPLVGAGIGMLQAAAAELGRSRLSPLVLAVLVVALSAWVTRGMHLDGLADFADGLGGGGRDRDSVLRIMRDSRIGTFGALAVGLVVAVKAAATEALLGTQLAMPALVLAPMLARWTSVPASLWLPYARSEGGMGSALTELVGARELVGATAIAGVVVVFLDARLGVVAWTAAAVSASVVFAMARARTGGVTGDVLGAGVEIAEAGALLVVSAWA